jgi:hypothetical protein
VLVTKYCVTCHNERLKTPAASPLLLDKANLDDPGADPATWEKVVRKLNLGSMPPQGSPLPDPESATGLRTWLAASLDRAADARNNAGRVALHRLNRTEYANAVRDLLGVAVDVAGLLPPYFGGGMSNGNQHDRNTPPAVLVGGANGRMKGNNHVAANRAPAVNLLLNIAEMADVRVEKIGSSTGRLNL